MRDVECPYCGSEQDICHDDGYGYEEDQTHEQECADCGKSFAFTTALHFYYEAHQADCLNGAEHRYRPTMAVPRRYTKMECQDCGDRRPCTEQELQQAIENGMEALR